MLLYPIEQSFRSDLRDLSTSPFEYVTFCCLKLSYLLVCEFMWDNITPSAVAFCVTSLSAVLLKNSFSADGSACSVLMFGLRMRWITFQISLLFFEDKLSYKNDFSFLCLRFWFCFWILCRFPSFRLLDIVRFMSPMISIALQLIEFHVFHTGCWWSCEFCFDKWLVFVSYWENQFIQSV